MLRYRDHILLVLSKGYLGLALSFLAVYFAEMFTARPAEPNNMKQK